MSQRSHLTAHGAKRKRQKGGGARVSLSPILLSLIPIPTRESRRYGLALGDVGLQGVKRWIMGVGHRPEVHCRREAGNEQPQQRWKTCHRLIKSVLGGQDQVRLPICQPGGF